ncbi:MAG: signal recognition particle protein [Bacteroidales bacterium]|nr:signal recognition particle protein [Candidatus Colimorpha pelethequi]MCQ2261949.1 signal recognition particle protein [Bacteroidales bacterium]
MFENLSSKIEKALHTLKGKGSITDINIAETVKEVRKALIDADVSYPIAKEFTDKVKAEALGRNVIQSIEPGQLMVKIVHEELTKLMGSECVDINIKGMPAVILIAGLQGSGKTTFSAKLAYYLKNKKSKNVMLVAGDVYRPAAISQLQTLGEQIQVPVFTEIGNTNPIDIAEKAIREAKLKGVNVVIVDTAGRLAVDEEMMREIAGLKEHLQPQETLFVVDSMTGQDAVNTAKTFNERIDYDGVVLTKLDGDTRGGAALTIRYSVNKPIKFVGIGEKMDALDVFHPDRMANRILGMGDVVSFVERAQEQYDEAEARKIQKKIIHNEYNFNDFLSQINQIKKMGNLKDLMGMIPGLNKITKDVEIGDDAFVPIESMIASMTPYERQHPSCINGSRKQRIAAGSGRSIQDLNRFLKQFEDTRKMMKAVSTNKGGKLPQFARKRR